MKKRSHRKRTPARRPRRDPVVEDVRRIRAKISRKHGHDLRKHFEELREIEATSGAKVVHKRDRRSSA